MTERKAEGAPSLYYGRNCNLCQPSQPLNNSLLVLPHNATTNYMQLFNCKFKLIYKDLTFYSELHEPPLKFSTATCTDRYPIGQLRCRAFPSLQKVLPDNGVL